MYSLPSGERGINICTYVYIHMKEYGLKMLGGMWMDVWINESF